VIEADTWGETKKAINADESRMNFKKVTANKLKGFYMYMRNKHLAPTMRVIHRLLTYKMMLCNIAKGRWVKPMAGWDQIMAFYSDHPGIPPPPCTIVLGGQKQVVIQHPHTLVYTYEFHGNVLHPLIMPLMMPLCSLSCQPG
jgi:hypothetical protein